MAINRRNVLSAAVALGVAALASHGTVAAQPQSYPTKPIRIVVPYAPGGPVDVVARVIGERLESYFQQRVLVDNRAGGAATIGTEHVARSTPDGYTLLMGAPAHTANPSMMKLNFDTAKDFIPISNIIEQPMVIVVHPSVPAKTVPELIDLLKANPDKYNYGTSGAGGPQHLMGEVFKSTTGTRIVHIPYKGAAPAGTAILAGETQISFGTPTNTMPHVRTGKLRALAVSTRERSPFAPELPTLHELGFKDFNYFSWTGLFAPAGTPPEIVNKLHEGIKRALAEPEIREKLMKAGMQPVGSSPKEFAEFIQLDMARAAKIVKETGIQPE
jgi:tripartite-type tricarboxylate transporter receptor subunit TctC